MRRLRLQTVRLGNNRDFAAAIARPHLQRVLQLADLLDQNSPRLRFRPGEINFRCLPGKNLFRGRAVDQLDYVRGEPPFPTSFRARNQIGVGQTFAFLAPRKNSSAICGAKATTQERRCCRVGIIWARCPKRVVITSQISCSISSGVRVALITQIR